MKTYYLSAKVTISIYTKVEADTLEDAIEKSEDRQIEHAEFNSEYQETQAWVADEYDGEPQDIQEVNL